MKTKILITIAMACILIINACNPPQTEEVIEIGLITPLTGRLASLGETVQRSVDLAVEEINQQGGIHGKHIKVIFEDSKGEVNLAVNAAHKLLDVDDVSILIDGATSGEAAAIAPIAQDNKKIHYSIFATTEALVDAGDYVFKMRENAAAHTQVITEVMLQKDIHEVAIIHLADEYCMNMVTQFVKHAHEKGIEIVDIENYQKEDNDVRSQITKIKHTKAQGVYVCGFYKELGLVFKQLYELDVDKQFFSVTTFEHPLVKKDSGIEAIEGVIYSVSPLHCFSAQGFCEKYESKYSIKPDYRAAFAYDTMHIVAQVLEESEDPDEIKDLLLDVVHDGATGITTFDEKGNTIKEVVVHQVKNGEWVSYP